MSYMSFHLESYCEHQRTTIAEFSNDLKTCHDIADDCDRYEDSDIDKHTNGKIDHRHKVCLLIAWVFYAA